MYVNLAMGFRSPFAIEHPPHSWSSPLTHEVEILMFHPFLEQHFVCVVVSAVEGVDVSGGGRNFRLSRSSYGISSVYHPTLGLWAVPVLQAKLSNQGEMYDLPSVQLESYPIFITYICMAFECQIWKRDEVVAH